MRYFFIDIFRFIAIILMIQGHTFDALLEQSERASSWFPMHDYIHGYVAPMFLFGAGVAFIISTFKKWDLYTSITFESKKRFFRYFGLIIIGYFLHLPHFSFAKVAFGLTNTEYLNFVQSDVLQCIGVSLFLTQALVLFSQSQKLILYFSIIVVLITIILTPFFWSIKFEEFLPVWIASYFSFQLKSWFPLFPWVGYLFSGIIIGYSFNYFKEINLKKYFSWISFISVVLIVLTKLFGKNVTSLYPPHDIWKSGSIYFIEHVAYLILIFTILYLVTKNIKSIPVIIKIAAVQSLLIYFIHLMILYGSSITSGLNFLFYRDLSLIITLLVFVGLLLIIYWFLKLWDAGKNKFPLEMRQMGYIAIFALLLEFVLNNIQ
ncbi:MAG: heparan-alpha-glucosaminide N-acetyltransferase domain-containing protein [Bacteroidetes bacterium]|nr:heparan-alpha-glucosaminide N-acetyltransferase domain-containing protein [Bacteroidota bacterium]